MRRWIVSVRSRSVTEVCGREAVRGLAGHGPSVTVVRLAGHRMDRQLGPEAGKVPARTLSRLRIRARLEARVAGLHADEDVTGAAGPPGSS